MSHVRITVGLPTIKTAQNLTVVHRCARWSGSTLLEQLIGPPQSKHVTCILIIMFRYIIIRVVPLFSGAQSLSQCSSELGFYCGAVGRTSWLLSPPSAAPVPTGAVPCASSLQSSSPTSSSVPASRGHWPPSPGQPWLNPLEWPRRSRSRPPPSPQWRVGQRGLAARAGLAECSAPGILARPSAECRPTFLRLKGHRCRPWENWCHRGHLRHPWGPPGHNAGCHCHGQRRLPLRLRCLDGWRQL